MRLTFSKPVFRQHPLTKNLLDETQLVRSKPASPAGSIPALRIRLASFHSAIIPCAKQLRGASDRRASSASARVAVRWRAGRESGREGSCPSTRKVARPVQYRRRPAWAIFRRTRRTRAGWTPARPTPFARAWRIWIGESEPPTTLRNPSSIFI